MKRVILLAGPSNSGKSTLADALSSVLGSVVISTSNLLREELTYEQHLTFQTSASTASFEDRAYTAAVNNPATFNDRFRSFLADLFETPTLVEVDTIRNPSILDDLYKIGSKLDLEHPDWISCHVDDFLKGTHKVVVDSIRSEAQTNVFLNGYDPLLVNVTADDVDFELRGEKRNSGLDVYYFKNPHITWNSSRTDILEILQRIDNYEEGAVDLIIGGQYGSEGKGKLADLLSPGYQHLVRSGGPNAGHWVRSDTMEFCFHQIPSGTLNNPTANLYIAAGATIDLPGLVREMYDVNCITNNINNRLFIDDKTFLITAEDKAIESSVLVSTIGSTASGAGAAAARRVSRVADISAGELGLVGQCTGLSLTNVSDKLSQKLRAGDKVCVEGTQGSALSLYHGPYPYVTSRDTNVAGLLSEVGIATKWVRDIWMVIRSFPIRVAGNSGPMSMEITWEDVSEFSGRTAQDLRNSEITSTTKRQRRVGLFDTEQYVNSVLINQPTHIFLTFADYLDPKAMGVRDWGMLPSVVRDFASNLEDLGGVPVVGISTGRMREDVAWKPGYGLPLPQSKGTL